MQFVSQYIIKNNPYPSVRSDTSSLWIRHKATSIWIYNSLKRIYSIIYDPHESFTFQQSHQFRLVVRTQFIKACDSPHDELNYDCVPKWAQLYRYKAHTTAWKMAFWYFNACTPCILIIIIEGSVSKPGLCYYLASRGDLYEYSSREQRIAIIVSRFCGFWNDYVLFETLIAFAAIFLCAVIWNWPIFDSYENLVSVTVHFTHQNQFYTSYKLGLFCGLAIFIFCDVGNDRPIVIGPYDNSISKKGYIALRLWGP